MQKGFGTVSLFWKGEVRTRPELTQGPEWGQIESQTGWDNLGVPDSYDRSDSWPTSFSSTTTQP